MATSGHQEWETRQAKTFARWCNMYLSKANKKNTVDENALNESFRDGCTLAQLLHGLYAGSDYWPQGAVQPVFKGGKSKIQRLDNITQVVKIYDKIGIRHVGWTREHIEEGNWTMTLGMVWCVILHANISVITTGDTSGEEALLLWCRKQCAGKNHVDGRPTNWTTNWKNGMVFNALLHRFYPERVDYNSLDPNCAKDNLEHALNNYEQLGIPRLVDVADMMVDKPDSKQVKVYVSEIFKLLSSMNQAERAREHVINFLQFNRRLKGSCADYERGAKEYMAFIEESCGNFASHKDADNEAQARRDVDTYKAWTDTAHEYDKKRIDLCMLNANIQAQLKANGRTPWECPSDMGPDALDGAAVKLTQEQEKHFDRLRKHRFSFLDKEPDTDEKAVEEAVKAFKYFDKENCGQLDREDFYAAMNAVGIVLADAEKEQVFTHVAAADDKISLDEFTNYVTTFFTAADTPEGLLRSAETLGDPKCFDAEAAGLQGDDLATFQGEVPDKNLDGYIRQNFSKDSSSY